MQSPLESGKNPTRAFISMTMEKHLKIKVPGSGWMEKKARSYLELQHNARYYIGIDNNRVGPKQPSNRRVTDSRLLSAHHLFR